MSIWIISLTPISIYVPFVFISNKIDKRIQKLNWRLVFFAFGNGWYVQHFCLITRPGDGDPLEGILTQKWDASILPTRSSRFLKKLISNPQSLFRKPQDSMNSLSYLSLSWAKWNQLRSRIHALAHYFEIHSNRAFRLMLLDFEIDGLNWSDQQLELRSPWKNRDMFPWSKDSCEVLKCSAWWWHRQQQWERR